MQQYAWLTWEMSKREITQRYRGTLLGLLWPVLYGVLLLAVFSFVFIKLLQVRWGSEAAGGPTFGALMIFSGLVPYLFIADVLSRSPGYVTGMAHLVKRVRFPVQLIPLIQTNAALFLLTVNLVLLLGFAAVTTGISLATILACVAITTVMYLFSLGLAWLFSSVGVFFQDLAQFTPVAVQVLLFLAPIFYPLEAVPESFRPYVEINPLTYYATAFRGAIIGHGAMDWGLWLKHLVVAILVACMGYVVFHRLRRSFGDLL